MFVCIFGRRVALALGCASSKCSPVVPQILTQTPLQNSGHTSKSLKTANLAVPQMFVPQISTQVTVSKKWTEFNKCKKRN